MFGIRDLVGFAIFVFLNQYVQGFIKFQIGIAI